MNMLKSLGLAAALLIAGAGLAAAQTYTKGTVKKVDAAGGKVTIIHEELVDLDMPAMTMVFRLAEPVTIDQFAEGQDIEFVADRVKGKLTVTELK